MSHPCRVCGTALSLTDSHCPRCGTAISGLRYTHSSAPKPVAPSGRVYSGSRPKFRPTDPPSAYSSTPPNSHSAGMRGFSAPLVPQSWSMPETRELPREQFYEGETEPAIAYTPSPHERAGALLGTPETESFMQAQPTTAIRGASWGQQGYEHTPAQSYPAPRTLSDPSPRYAANPPSHGKKTSQGQSASNAHSSSNFAANPPNNPEDSTVFGDKKNAGVGSSLLLIGLLMMSAGVLVGGLYLFVVAPLFQEKKSKPQVVRKERGLPVGIDPQTVKPKWEEEMMRRAQSLVTERRWEAAREVLLNIVRRTKRSNIRKRAKAQIELSVQEEIGDRALARAKKLATSKKWVEASQVLRSIPPATLASREAATLTRQWEEMQKASTQAGRASNPTSSTSEPAVPAPQPHVSPRPTPTSATPPQAEPAYAATVTKLFRRGRELEQGGRWAPALQAYRSAIKAGAGSDKAMAGFRRMAKKLQGQVITKRVGCFRECKRIFRRIRSRARRNARKRRCFSRCKSHYETPIFRDPKPKYSASATPTPAPRSVSAPTPTRATLSAPQARVADAVVAQYQFDSEGCRKGCRSLRKRRSREICAARCQLMTNNSSCCESCVRQKVGDEQVSCLQGCKQGCRKRCIRLFGNLNAARHVCWKHCKGK